MTDNNGPTWVSIELLRKYDRPGPRYTSYPTAPVWTQEVGGDQYVSALRAASVDPGRPIAVYCHIPFCRRRCYYCGCNTCVADKLSQADPYVAALKREIDKTAALLGSRNTISQLHLGGGTPTFLDVDGLRAVIEQIEKHFEFAHNCEKSIEIDPRVTTTEQLDFLSARGFNRVSLGVQDFDSDVQKAIGRIQPEKDTVNILEHCRRLGFRGINFDLIYGLPRQGLESFNRTLERVINLRPDRLAVYSFAYLPGVKVHQSKIDPEELPSAEVKYRLFASAIEKLTAAGYRQIGMDHFALPDDELAVAQIDGRLHRNFMGYTVQAAPEMIGFGMSSIGYVDNSFFQNMSRLNSYKDAVANGGFAVYRGMILSRDDLIRQYVISSLMCNFRLDYNRLLDMYGVEYKSYFHKEHSRLSDLFDDGLIVERKSGLEITPIGRTFVRNIAMVFDAYLDEKSRSKGVTFSRTI
jgi:oxygen-independent coproporphyrinogen-3 oxidase